MEYIEHSRFYTKVMDAPLEIQEYWMKKFAELMVILHQMDWKKIIIEKAPKNLDSPFFTIDAYLPEFIADWRKFGYKFGFSFFEDLYATYGGTKTRSDDGYEIILEFIDDNGHENI